MIQQHLENTENTNILRDRFVFLFDGTDISLFRKLKKEREEKERLEKIRIEKAKIRRRKRREKLMQLEKELSKEINLYLLKVSPPRDDFEEMLLEKMRKELGTITSVKEVSDFLKISRSHIYQAIDNGEILSLQRGRRKFIVTDGLIPFLRN